MHRHLDITSRLVILVTFALFVAAIFFKGFSHDILLEAAVFLVSVKLILLAYNNSVAASQLNDRLDGVQTTLARMESLITSRHPRDLDARLIGQAPGPAAPADRSGDESKGSDRQ
ncbi:MAG TPA: hypothetical protein VNE16_06700 [Vicinamibacterales bacterium]|nr:hypothetical protein [Vicinamibacterales bacterium]